jgi:hypothetical protein
MRITESRLRKLIREIIDEKPNARVVRKGGHSLITAGDYVVLMSSWAKNHIEGTHNKPGKGSVFSHDVDVDDIAQKIANIPQEFFDGGGGVFTLEVPNIGYDLVDAPGKILKMYSDAKRVKVEKEERGKPVMVTGYIVDALIDDFVTDKLSVVLRPTREVKYLPEDLQEDPVVTRAVENGKLMSVLSSWPGKETPAASQWLDDYAVIIPTGD